MSRLRLDQLLDGRKQEYLLKMFLSLSPRFKAKHEKHKRIQRLLENDDFIHWQEDILSPWVEDLRARILDSRTHGYQHDFLKAHLQVLEAMQTGGIQESARQLEREMENIIRYYEKKGGSDGL
jgi:hypothetical protein